MSYTYDKRRQGADASKKQKTPSPQPSLDALRSGSAKPTSEQMGHRVDLPDAMREKMESAFGADLSTLKGQQYRLRARHAGFQQLWRTGAAGP